MERRTFRGSQLPDPLACLKSESSPGPRGRECCLPLIGGRKVYSLLLGFTLAIFLHSLPARVGLASARIGDHVTCALFLVNFIFFIGAGAGAIVVGTMAHALGGERARPVARIAELGAMSSLLVATVFLALDLGQLGHFWHLLSGIRFTRVPGFHLMILATYLANALALGYLATRADLLLSLAPRLPARMVYRLVALGLALAYTTPARGPTLGQLTVILVPAVVLLHSVPAWIIGLLDAELGAYAVAVAALFYVSSLASSLALVVVTAVVSRAFLGFQVSEHIILGLGRVLLLLVPILGYSLFLEMQLVIATREPAGAHLFAELVRGAYAPFFWFALLGGVMAPFFLLAQPRGPTTARIGLAALLVVVAVLVERWSLVITTALGHAHPLYGNGGYAPRPFEVLATLAVYAIGLLAWVLLGRTAPPSEPAISR